MEYNTELSMKFNFEGPEDTAYRLCCVWHKFSRQMFPTYLHTKMPQVRNLRKSVLFRTMLKLIKERNFKTLGEYEYFIKAQLSLFKKLQSSDNPVLIEPVILTGEPAERRWFFWHKLVAESNKLTRMVYSMKDSDLEFDLGVSLTEIKKICEDELVFENYFDKQNKIRTAVILKRIKPIYIYLSHWIQRLPEEIKKDFMKRTDASSFDKFDVTHARKVYEVLFSFEINKS